MPASARVDDDGQDSSRSMRYATRRELDRQSCATALAESPAGTTAQNRVVAAPADFGMVLLVTAFAVAGLFAVIADRKSVV